MVPTSYKKYHWTTLQTNTSLKWALKFAYRCLLHRGSTAFFNWTFHSEIFIFRIFHSCKYVSTIVTNIFSYNQHQLSEFIVVNKSSSAKHYQHFLRLKALRQPGLKRLAKKINTLFFIMIATYTALDHSVKIFSKLCKEFQRKHDNNSRKLVNSSSL